MNFKFKLPSALIDKCSNFEEFANGGSQVTIELNNGTIINEALISNSMYLVAIRGYDEPPFSASEIKKIFQTENDKNPVKKGCWHFWDDWKQ